jgi:PKD repeat protein
MPLLRAILATLGLASIATSLSGCPPVTPTTKPSAAFTATPTSGTAPLVVSFTDNSTDGTSTITEWDWNFGDGNISTEENPTYEYATPGTFTVSLTVTSADGSDTETKTGLITVNSSEATAPTADFTATPTAGAAPLTVQFTDGSADGSSPVEAWAWDFGDGETSTVESPSHVYDTAGTYSVTLSVTSDDGSDDEVRSNLITVTSGSGTGPTAAFSADPVSGDAPLTVQFTDESTPGTSPITTWTWDFGDGSTSEGADPSHIYSAVGTYTVSLTVTTLDGVDTEIKADLISVGEDAAWAPDTSTFDVALAPDVLRVPEAELENVILQWTPEEHAYLLDKTETDRLGLTIAVGEPLILDGIEVGRVSVLDITGDEIYLETEEMPLNEIFPDADISWDYGVQFTADTVKSIEIPGVGEFAVKADTPINITFEQGEFKYELVVVLKKTAADFDFTVTKGIGAGVKARFTAKGQIEQFRNKNQILFEGGQLTNFGHELKGMRGNTDLKLVMAGSGADAIDFKLPVPIMKIPFVVGYIPATLSVGAQFVVNAVVPIEGSAQVGTSFKYDSDIGLTYNGTEVMAGGRAGDTTFGDPLHQTGAASAISANFGIGFPRVTLSIAGGTLVPWAQTAFLVGGSYTFTPPCQTADAQFIGAVGYNLGILGFELASGSKTLFTHKKELLRAGQCPAPPKSALSSEAAMWLSSDGLIELDDPILVEYN